MLSGGIKEATRYLNERKEIYKSIGIDCLLIAFELMLLGGYLMYRRWQRRKKDADFRAYLEALRRPDQA